MNMRLFAVLGALACAAMTGCVVVGNTPDGTGGNGGNGGNGAGVGGAGGGTGGQGGAAATCDAKLGCADATTEGSNPMNLPPCPFLEDGTTPNPSATALKEYMDCVCSQATCQNGAHGLCPAAGGTIKYDFPFTSAPQTCQDDITKNCSTKATACGSDVGP